MKIIGYIKYEKLSVISDMKIKRAYTRVGPKVSGLTYKIRAKWKMLRGIYNTIYGETILKNSKFVYIY